MRLRLLVIASLLAGAAGVASVPLFLLQGDDEVTTADAIVVLAGERARLPVGLELLERGVAPVLVISDGLHDLRWTQANRLCRFGDPRRFLCPRPDPYSTRGEARAAARLARGHRWRSLVVVTSRFHVFRARRLFRRCFDGKLAFVAVDGPARRLPLALASEWAKLGHATLRREC